MRFLYPLGLLGLIGVPILIIIYIIKNKYTEQVISSTYLWTLSEKFLKKRLPINKLVGIISLILQILMVVFISLGVAHPVFTRAGAAHDYCFILDNSGSMGMEQGGRTRLEIAKSEISDIIDGSVDGSSYSLILSGATTGVLFEGVEDKSRALDLVRDVEPSDQEGDVMAAQGEAQSFYNSNRSIKIYLVTDKSFETTQNVTLINVAGNAENYAVTDVEFRLDGDKLTVTGKATSYVSDADLTVELRVNGGSDVKATATVQTRKLVPESFTLNCTAETLEYFTVGIAQGDALGKDSDITVYNVDQENSYTVLLVSDTPFYMQAVLASAGNAKVQTIATKDYDPVKHNGTQQTGGQSFDMYIFDSYSPATMPDNAAVWFINPTSSVANSGFAVQDEVIVESGAEAAYTSSSATLARTLLKNMYLDTVHVTQYQKCNFSRNYTTLLSYDGNPLVFAGTNVHGNRQVVFSFALNLSSYPYLTDFNILMSNLLNYTFPKVIEKTDYYCGETMQVNIVSGSSSVRVISPSGSVRYLDAAGTVYEIELTEVGTYRIINMSGSGTKEYNVYSAMPESERNPQERALSFGLQGQAENHGRDGVYSDLIVLFIILGLLFIADWMVYCYEQYQLR